MLLSAALTIGALALVRAQEQSPAPSPAGPKLASFKERVAAAQTVKVQTDILGIHVGDTFEQAERTLEKHASHPPKDEAEEEEEAGGKKVLWELKDTDYSTIFVKGTEKNGITSILGTFRPGKEMPFDKIGEVQKAPIHGATNVAWDVARPNHPLTRVVAQGTNGKAKAITILVVPRPKGR